MSPVTLFVALLGVATPRDCTRIKKTRINPLINQQLAQRDADHACMARKLK
jgi:hypothetical protein